MNRRVYLNNAATTFPKPEDVYQFMDAFYRSSAVNIGRGQEVPNNIWQSTKDLLLGLFHCSNKEVVFTHTATEAINIILQGLPIQDGANVYITPFEHNAVVRVLNHIKKTRRIQVITLAVDDQTLVYDMNAIAEQFKNAKPHFTIISHGSNVCGLVAPILEICTLAYAYQSTNIIDMCQTAGLIDTDISSDIYDFIIFAGHKTLYGPFGISGFLCSRFKKLAPLIFGGTGVDSINDDVPDTIPERFEVGSRNVLAVAGLYASLTWIKEQTIATIFEKEKENHTRLLEILHQYENIKIIEPQGETIGVVATVFDGYSSDNISQILTEHGIEVRSGLQCAPIAHQFLKTSPAGTVRFSISFFNTEYDFEVLDEVLHLIYENS